MKKYISALIFFFALSFLSYSQEMPERFKRTHIPDTIQFMYAPTLQASFNTALFYSPVDGPYIETYISVFGKSVNYKKNENDQFQASIEIVMLFKQEDKIIDFRKYNLLSPEVDPEWDVEVETTEENTDKEKLVTDKFIIHADTLNNFIDLQRISLPVGLYDLELIIKDNYSDSSAFRLETTLDLQFDQSKVEISSIQMIESYSPTTKENVLSKSGYDIVPYISDYFPENINDIIFYAEIYNSNKFFTKGESYLLKTYIESYETEKSLHNFNKFVKQEVGDVNIVLNTFKIHELPSGNYNLVVEVRNRDNELVSQEKVFFQRSNPGEHFLLDDISTIGIANTFIANQNDLDTLSEYLKCLYAISDIIERRYAENILKINQDERKTELMKQFFYNFWSSRNPTDPGGEWAKYQSKVYMTNLSYTTFIKKGYETDRGRVFLQYGVPNTIREEKFGGDYYPFEIWHFQSLNGKMDRKFLFYNPSIVGDDYILLHSNVPGEIVSRNFENLLLSRNKTPIEITDNFSTDSDVYSGDSPQTIWDNP